MIESFSHIPLNKTWVLLIGVFRTIINKFFDIIFIGNIKFVKRKIYFFPIKYWCGIFIVQMKPSIGMRWYYHVSNAGFFPPSPYEREETCI